MAASLGLKMILSEIGSERLNIDLRNWFEYAKQLYQQSVSIGSTIISDISSERLHNDMYDLCEECIRLAETRLAQNILTYMKPA